MEITELITHTHTHTHTHTCTHKEKKKTLESPLGRKEIKPVNPKGNQP